MRRPPALLAPAIFALLAAAAPHALLAQVQPAPDQPSHAPPSEGAAPPAATGGDITVLGRKEEIRNELKQLLNEQDDQLARFESEFCPRVIGFDKEWTPIIERLIRENVVAAGFKAEPAPCTPTAVVIFSYEPQALMAGLRERMPGLFTGFTPVQLDRLTKPVRATYSWRAVDMLSRDGIPLQNAEQINGEPAQAKVVRNAYPTRLYSNVRFDIVNSYLVLDINRTPGMSLQQIADFATMHLLLDLSDDAAADARQDSILRLFDAADPATVPATMSAFDRGMLSGLYGQSQNNRRANQQRGRIAEHIKDSAGAE